MPCIDTTDIVQELLKLYTLDEVDEWLNTPQELLGGRAPEGLIAEGRSDEVRALIRRINDGAYL